MVIKQHFSTIESMVENNLCCGYLLRFCQREFTAENLLFIMEVDDYRDFFAGDNLQTYSHTVISSHTDTPSRYLLDTFLILFICFINTLCQRTHTLLTHPLNLSYQPILSIHTILTHPLNPPINPPFQPTHLTHPLNPPSHFTLSIHPLIHLSPHPLTHPLIHLSPHPLTHPLIHLSPHTLSPTYHP